MNFWVGRSRGAAFGRVSPTFQTDSCCSGVGVSVNTHLIKRVGSHLDAVYGVNRDVGAPKLNRVPRDLFDDAGEIVEFHASVF